MCPPSISTTSRFRISFRTLVTDSRVEATIAARSWWVRRRSIVTERPSSLLSPNFRASMGKRFASRTSVSRGRRHLTSSSYCTSLSSRSVIIFSAARGIGALLGLSGEREMTEDVPGLQETQGRLLAPRVRTEQLYDAGDQDIQGVAVLALVVDRIPRLVDPIGRSYPHAPQDRQEIPTLLLLHLTILVPRGINAQKRPPLRVKR